MGHGVQGFELLPWGAALIGDVDWELTRTSNWGNTGTGGNKEDAPNETVLAVFGPEQNVRD